MKTKTNNEFTTMTDSSRIDMLRERSFFDKEEVTGTNWYVVKLFNNDVDGMFDVEDKLLVDVEQDNEKIKKEISAYIKDNFYLPSDMFEISMGSDSTWSWIKLGVELTYVIQKEKAYLALTDEDKLQELQEFIYAAIYEYTTPVYVEIQ